MSTRSLRVISIAAIAVIGLVLSTTLLGVFYYDWTGQRNLDSSLDEFTRAERESSDVVITYKGSDYAIDRRSPLWKELSEAIHAALASRGQTVSYYHPTAEATVVQFASAEHRSLCEVRIEDSFIQINRRRGVLTDVDLKGIITSRLFPPKKADE